jgi:hypothetical protein
MYCVMETWRNDATGSRNVFLNTYSVLHVVRDYSDSNTTRAGGVLTAVVPKPFYALKRGPDLDITKEALD